MNQNDEVKPEFHWQRPIHKVMTGIVRTITHSRIGVQELQVETADGSLRNAMNYTHLAGDVKQRQRVLLNTTAVEMGLGTGGIDFVVANLDADSQAETPEGHILKLRYTPMQFPVLAVESPESPHHQTLAGFETLGEMPVVCVELHSQLPGVCAGVEWAYATETNGRKPRVVFVMSDGAALPIAFSRIVPQLKERGWLCATITCGQAFGGDFEAVNLYSALAAAKEVAKADIVVIGQGPGNTGTSTPLGFSGISQGEALNAADALDGTAIAALRLSFADNRPHHQGISSHTIITLKKIVRCRAYLPIPELPTEQYSMVLRNLEEKNITECFDVFRVPSVEAVEMMQSSGLQVTTMGRTIEQDRAFFLASASAGILAGQLFASNH